MYRKILLCVLHKGKSSKLLNIDTRLRTRQIQYTVYSKVHKIVNSKQIHVILFSLVIYSGRKLESRVKLVEQLWTEHLEATLQQRE